MTRAKWSAKRARAAFADCWTRYGWRDDQIEAHLTRAYLAGWEAAARRLEVLEDELVRRKVHLYAAAAMLDNERHVEKTRLKGARVKRAGSKEGKGR